MGQHVWLLLATIITELLVITKWSKGQFSEPFPPMVKMGWIIGLTLLVLYPAVQVSYLIGSLRIYLFSVAFVCCPRCLDSLFFSCVTTD
jgi:phosphatidylserine synthase 2